MLPALAQKNNLPQTSRSEAYTLLLLENSQIDVWQDSTSGSVLPLARP